MRITSSTDAAALLQRDEFLFGDAVNAVKGRVLDADVFADDLSRHAGLAQSECERVRHGQSTQRGFALAEIIRHPIRIRRRDRSGLSSGLLQFLRDFGLAYVDAAETGRGRSR